MQTQHKMHSLNGGGGGDDVGWNIPAVTLDAQQQQQLQLNENAQGGGGGGGGQMNKSFPASWGALGLPKLAFLSEVAAEEEEAEARFKTQRSEELSSDDVIVIDNAPPMNSSDAEKERDDEEGDDYDDDDDDESSDESEGEEEIGEEYDERELEIVITRLARYGPSIIKEKTAQKHQTMSALANACPRATCPSIYPTGTVRCLPDPVAMGMSTPGMDAHWSGIALEPDPPPFEANPNFQKIRRPRGPRQPLQSPKEDSRSDSDGEGSPVKKRGGKSENGAARGRGGGQLWLGRVKGPGSSSLLGEKRKHGGNIVTTTGSAAAAGKAAVKTTAADGKKLTGQQKLSLARNNDVLKGGKAAASSSLGGCGDAADHRASTENHHHHHPNMQANAKEVRMQQARQLLWAQHLYSAGKTVIPVVSAALENQNSTNSETNVPAARNAPPPNASDKTQQGASAGAGPDSSALAASSSDKNLQPPKIIRDKSKHRKNNADGVCRVNLTVNWKARTRSRSGMQPPSVKLVTVDVHPGEICARFISRMVQMPPGGKYNDTQLNWGSFVLQPTQVMEEFYNGSWVLNLRSEPPPELVLVLPVGSLLVHPALCETAGWRFSVGASRPVAPPVAAAAAGSSDGDGGGSNDDNMDIATTKLSGHAAKRMKQSSKKHDNLLIDGWVPTKKAVKAAAAAGIVVLPERGGAYPSSEHQGGGSDDVKEVKVLSNRALHPGRTDPKRMAEVLREYEVVVDSQPCSIVDVGSGDGHFVSGLIKAFPQACLCGIECQRDLYDESVNLAGRNANFILGTAETQLAQCLSASVIIATTHNFDVSTIVSMVRCAARLPAVTHLVLGESRLCTPRCKAICGPCCCFEPLGTEDVPTYWGNSFLSFTVYRRVVPWMLEANEVPRVTDEATLAALNSGELDPQIRQMGAGGARAVAGSTEAGGPAAAGCVADAFDGLFGSLWPGGEKAVGGEGGGSGGSGAAGGAGDGGGAAGGRHGGVGQPACTSVSLEDVREATARLQRPTNPPEKFSDHDMHVRRHRYPSSRAERRDNRDKDAEEDAGEDADDDADDASGDGKASAQQQQQQAPAAAAAAAAAAKGPGIVGRLLKLVGRTD